MAVYTNIDKEELDKLLQQYDIGSLQSFTPIEDGITNSNYLITTNKSSYVLTLFEELADDELPFYLDLVSFLADRGLPCARPVKANDQTVQQSVESKPAVLAKFLPGESAERSSISHCQAVGDMLGRMHLATHDFGQRKPNTRGETWRNEAVEQLFDILPTKDALLLQEELGFHKTQEFELLPRGIIHADLFPDNVLFSKGKITGIIDFYYACYDSLLLDVAIAVHAWCQDGDGHFDNDRINALIDAYELHREFTLIERECWHGVRRTAALRFWLSRLLDKHFPPTGAHVQIKDPDEYKQILLNLSYIPNP